MITLIEERLSFLIGSPSWIVVLCMNFQSETLYHLELKKREVCHRQVETGEVHPIFSLNFPLTPHFMLAFQRFGFPV